MHVDSWDTPCFELTKESLRRLIDNQLAAIHLVDFATDNECQRLNHALRHMDVERRDATTTAMTLIGSNFSNHRGLSKTDYFATVDTAYRDLNKLTLAAGFDPLKRVIKCLSTVWTETVEVASESGYGRYFAGGIKSRTTSSKLHFDYVPGFNPDYVIGEVEDQLSWNLYVEMPGNTGSTTIYNSPVPKVRAAHPRSAWDTNIDAHTVADAQTYRFQPKAGEVVLFNTRNPHKVNVDDNDDAQLRTQAGSFIGRMSDDRLILWS